MNEFNGDGYLKATIQQLIERNGIRHIIETGSFIGHTTRAFADMAGQVTSIEVNPKYLERAKTYCADKTNINWVHGNSAEVLRVMLEKATEPILFYLDAHWQKYCPLKDELKAIAANGLQPVIVIHDFYVPGKSSDTERGGAFGYDMYNGQRFDWDWIAPEIRQIYPGGFKYFYNEKCEGAKRGVIFIGPQSMVHSPQ